MTETTKQAGAASGLAQFMRLPATKFVAIGFLVLLLLIPALMVWALVEERSDRARDVANEIATSWGRDQAVFGPVIAVPFLERIEQKPTRQGADEPRFKVERKFVFLFPETLAMKAEAEVEERHRSIFTLPVYRSAIDFSGRFSPAELDMSSLPTEGSVTLQPEEAFLFVGIEDTRAIKNDVAIAIAGAARKFEPGLNGTSYSMGGRYSDPSGIHVPISREEWQSGFDFTSKLALNGSRSIAFAPAGQSTTLALTSNWAHPGFSGTFLPDTHEISDEGTSASWSIPFLARGVAKSAVGNVPPLSSTMQVSFVDPLGIYQTVARSLKYSIAFFGLTFMAVFVLELRSGWRLHWIQYLLVGFAQVIFFVLLLAFTEQVGFALAYSIAFAATATLICAYIAAITHSPRSGAITAGALIVIYGVIYLILNDQDYALLAGSIVAFLALATVMFATRGVDWTGRVQVRTEPAATPA